MTTEKIKVREEDLEKALRDAFKTSTTKVTGLTPAQERALERADKKEKEKQRQGAAAS